MTPTEAQKVIKVLVVDDSQAEQLLLTHLLAGDPRISVIGTAGNGREALEFLKHMQPDIITMDLNMPELDGLSTTREIMAHKPVPIIIVTVDRSLTTASQALLLIEAGAVAVIEKPFTADEARQEELTSDLLRLVRNLSQVKLVHRHPLYLPANRSSARNIEGEVAQPMPLTRVVPQVPSATPVKDVDLTRSYRCIAMGASTGGPPVLKFLVDSLPDPLEVPVFIAQHMSPGFTEGFSHWLQKGVKHPVVIPTHGQRYRAGCIYMTPCNRLMGVDGNGFIILTPSMQKDYGFNSVTYLFTSIAREFGAGSLAVLLTGMGTDGASALKDLRDLGALTIAQDVQSSVVHGMPGEAIRLNGASMIMSPEQIARLINQVSLRL